MRLGSFRVIILYCCVIMATLLPSTVHSDKSEIEVFRVTGYADNDISHNGTIGFTMIPSEESTEHNVKYFPPFEKSEIKVVVCIPEGTVVFPEPVDQYDVFDGFVPAKLNPDSQLIVYIPTGSITSDDMYLGTYDPPTIKILYREAMFASLHDDSIAAVMHPGSLVTVIAKFGNEYYVSYEGEFGFLRQDGLMYETGGFTGSQSFERVYNRELEYFELLYIPYFAEDNFVIGEQDAVEIATVTVSPLLDDRGIDDYETSTFLNAAHALSPLGATWQVVFYGHQDGSDKKNYQFFVVFDDIDNSIMPIPTPGISKAPSIMEMSENDWVKTKDYFGSDIEDRYVYAVVEVSVNGGFVEVVDEIFFNEGVLLVSFRSP